MLIVDLVFLFIYTVKKKIASFPSPAGMSLPNSGGNNDVITELFLPRGSLVIDIPAGDGKLVNLFLRCTYFAACSSTTERMRDREPTRTKFQKSR
jgi:hypothetical protein